MKRYLIFYVMMVTVALTACGGNEYNASMYNTAAPVNDTAPAGVSVDSAAAMPDSTGITHTDNNLPEADTGKSQSDTSRLRAAADTFSKGAAVIYCPVRMTEDNGVTVTVRVTKAELKNAVYTSLLHQELERTHSRDTNAVKNSINVSDIRIAARMRAKMSYDTTIFKTFTSDNGAIRAFAGGNDTLEWDWTITPVKAIHATNIVFTIDGVDTNNRPVYLFPSQSVQVSVGIDPKNFLLRLLDFLGSDWKNTLTAILIPLITFIAGLFAKKAKKQ